MNVNENSLKKKSVERTIWVQGVAALCVCVCRDK